MTTFWAKVPQFEDVPEDNIILLEQYLTSAEGATTIFDPEMLGLAFKPVKNDMLGNIKKLRNRQSTNKEKFTSLNAILEDEKENKKTTEGQVGALWLCRALLFIQQLLVNTLDSLRNHPSETAFRPIIVKAYEETLKKYHGMITKALFSTVSRASPNRAAMIKLLAFNEEGKQEEVIRDIESYLVNLKKTNIAVMQILKDFGFDSEEKV